MAIAYGARVGTRTGTTTVSSFTFTTTANIPASALILVSVGVANAGDTSNLLSISDGVGNTYQSAAFTCDPGQNTMAAVWYSVTGNAVPSGSTITVTLHAPVLNFGQFQAASIHYVTGAATASIVDASATRNSQTTGTWDSNSATTTSSDPNARPRPGDQRNSPRSIMRPMRP